MRMLELFSGSGVMADAFRERGFDTLTIDNDPKLKAGWTGDIMDFNPKVIMRPVAVIWASPPCYAFSVAALSHHWDKNGEIYTPTSQACRDNLKLVERTLELIEVLAPEYWFIENPRAMLRKASVMQPLNQFRSTVTYCQYGEDRMKPTDIWTNAPISFRKPCNYGDPCHPTTPRGCKTVGTQSLNGSYARAKLPLELCDEVAQGVMNLLLEGHGTGVFAKKPSTTQHTLELANKEGE